MSSGVIDEDEASDADRKLSDAEEAGFSAALPCSIGDGKDNIRGLWLGRSYCDNGNKR